MPWYCNGCGRRMDSPVCKKKCRLKWGENLGAERIPPLDGFVLFEVDLSRTEAEDKESREAWFESKRKKKVS